MNGLRVIRRWGAAGAVLLAVTWLAFKASAADAMLVAIPHSSDFMPHGYCYLWNPLILWLNVISDGLIALSYYCIPIVLIYFIGKNPGVPFKKVFWMSGAFIVACGTTHLMEVWNVWHGNYLFGGVIKGITAAMSVVTAAMVLPLASKVMSQSGMFHLQEVNRRLEQQIAERKRFDAPINAPLRRKVTGGVLVAVLLTLLVGFSSWRGARRADEDAYWVSHTHEVMEMIQRTTRHVIEAETSARAFAVTGQEPLLVHYQTARADTYQNVQALRHLTADNLSQQRRLDVLQPQVGTAFEFADSIIAKRRQSQLYVAASAALETERFLELVRGTTDDMYAEETLLLSQRTQRAQGGQRLTKVTAIIGTLLGMGLWGLAWVAVNREINVSARARSQLIALNAELEQRVEQRTASLQSEIIERKRMAEALREQARVLDLAPVLVLDMDGRIVLWPQGSEKLYGFTSREALGAVSHELLRTQFPQPLATIQKELLDTGKWEGELVHRKSDGGAIVVSSLWVMYRDDQGNPMRVLEVNSDITAHKQGENLLAVQAVELSRQAEELIRSGDALEAQKEMLQSVLDSMVEGLVAADRQGKFIIWNTAAKKMVGLGPADVSPENWSAHFGVYLADTVTPFPPEQNPLLRAIHGEVSNSEMFLRNSQLAEGVWIETFGSPLKDKAGLSRGGVVAFHDITERKAHEREIKKLNQDLEARVIERTAELQTANHDLESFTYSVSHDLRAPLRHISGFAKILAEDFGSTLPIDALKHVQRIEQGAHRMGQLVDELLNLARVGRQALTTHVTELNAVVQDIVTLLEPESKGRQVEWKIAELPFVECDPILIRQVFQNLISNALKYSRPRSPAVIEIGQMEKDGETVIFVRDNGVGFSMKYADKLFGVFQRLHLAEQFEGTGVGLATVKRIVQKHGGTIWAEAALDQGATFYFTLGRREHSVSENAAAAAGD